MIFLLKTPEILEFFNTIFEFSKTIEINKLNFETKIANVRRGLMNFNSVFEFLVVQACVNLVDLVKSFLTSSYLQQSASVQPRTGLLKFANN